MMKPDEVGPEPGRVRLTVADTTKVGGDEDELRDRVRRRYASAATAVTAGIKTDNAEIVTADCCGPGGCGPTAEAEPGFGSELYTDAELGDLPPDAVTASLGCGNPLAVADLRDGDVVLDLGSGGGIDVLLSARRVGPSGKAYGLDMTDEMLALARSNAAAAGATNVEFLKGHIEDIPLPAATVDVVISNCVINLSTDKPAVFTEAHRVLKPGGRLGVTDVVAEDHLGVAERAERGSYVGCIAGALSLTEYRTGLEAAGFTEVTIDPTHEVADGMHSAIVRAVKPAASANPGSRLGGQ
jgi:ubiquinone/menaquinone biosynthesis C-methylase UbiE